MTDIVDDNTISVYFNEKSPNFQKSENINGFVRPKFEYNMLFLHHTERFFRERCLVMGHVFVNEVFDALGLPRTVEGQKKGWMSFGGPRIDFGIPTNLHDVVDRDGAFLLTLNTHGEIIEDI